MNSKKAWTFSVSFITTSLATENSSWQTEDDQNNYPKNEWTNVHENKQRTLNNERICHVWPPDVKSWLIWKDPHAGKDWRQEEKGTTKDEMVGWRHWLNGHEFE